MPRFTFSQRLGSKPSESDYNTIKDDFLDYVNSTKFTKDNLRDETIRFRHMARPPTLMLFKDCGDAIWNGNESHFFAYDDTWNLYSDSSSTASNTLQLDFELPAGAPGDQELVEFSFWYYPYSVSDSIKVAPALRNKNTGNWTRIADQSRFAGMAVGFWSGQEQPPYDPSRNGVVRHPYLIAAPTSITGVGSYDRPGTVGYGGPIICTVSLKKGDLVNVDAFGMMFKNNHTRDTWTITKNILGGPFGHVRSRPSRLDRLYLMLVARDY